MARIPTTAETLLRDLSGDSQHARWGELVTRYRPMLEAYMRERFPSVEADEEIASRLSNCAFGEARGTFVAGTVFGDWRITAFVAKGGTDEVYCAEHVAPGTSAAVKVLSEPLTDSRKMRFRREAKLLAELNSPSFPAFHGYGEANGRPYIAEELLEPGELPTGDGSRAKYLLALCAGLKALHEKGVVHRDLKPANILFRKTGEPVIVDLGLAKSVDVPLVPDGVSIVDGKAVGVGTPEFAAPEQFTGGDITPAADVHALGVLSEKLLQGRIGILSASTWKEIIRRATSSIASERYQSVDEFATAVRRRHWLRNGIVFCLLGLCGLVAVLAGRSPRGQLGTPSRHEMYDSVQKSLQPEEKPVRWPGTPRPPQGTDDPFTALFRCEGRDARGRKVYRLDLASKNHSVHTMNRITLQGPSVYQITGPGALLANIDGEGDVEIEIRQQANLINFTKVPLKDSSVKYALKGGSRLTLWCLRKEDAPDKLLCDPDFTIVDFMGAE